MRILVTGGAGYIGSHTARALAESGHEPVVLDDLRTGHENFVRWGPLVRGDIAETSALHDALATGPDAVIHFAASAYVGESMTDPEGYFRNNVVGSLRLLEAVLERGPIPIVFSSTCATYGIPTRVPIDEGHPQQPINPYGESKLFIERALQWYGELRDLPWMSLRYFNAAGADPAGELGERHDPETHLIPLALAATDTGELSVFGTDYPTPDGTAVRDYIHVTDLADGHLAAVEHLAGGGQSAVLNLGTGEGTSVAEVVAAVERVSGLEVATRDAPRRPGDPPELVADPRLAADVLGWKAQRSDIDTIVETAWRWRQQELG